jgi:hypothetical protein
MLWYEDHVWITFSKTQWGKYEKGFYIFLETLVEKTEDMIECLENHPKTLVEKLGDMLVVISPH